MTEPAEVARAVAEAHRREWAVVLAATACTVRDLDLAEDCVQEAYASALVAWARAGIPDNAAAWLTTIAKRRAMDALRRERAFRSKLPLLVEPEKTVDDEVVMGQQAAGGGEDAVPDERLRLIFMCCHPALAPEAQVALTLRLVCGMPTADIARAFLVSEQAMGARLTRAKRKISATRIPVRVPGAAELPDRLQTVLGVIHLLFTMGHTAPSGESLMRPDLVDRALHLTRMLREVGADHQARDYDEDEPDCDRDPGQDRCLDQRLVRREDVCSIRLWVANDAHAPIVHDPSCPGHLAWPESNARSCRSRRCTAVADMPPRQTAPAS